MELLHANPSYAHIKMPDGRETTTSLEDLARCPTSTEEEEEDEDSEEVKIINKESSTNFRLIDSEKD